MDSRVRRALGWTGAAGLITGALDAVATLALLRWWLTPEEYGIATVAATLYPMLDLVADAGMSAALVQRGELDDDTLATAFWVSTATSVTTALLVCALAPALAALHGHAVVAGLMTAYAIKLASQPIHWIPLALLRRELRFDAIARIRILAGVTELAAKLVAAAVGLGAWCFVAGQLAKAAVQAIATQAARPYVPRPRFRIGRARELVRYGAQVSSSQVLVHAYTSADYQIVGAFFGPAATGLYRAAYELVLEPTKLVSYVVVEVAFPVFARLRGDAAALRAQVIAFTRSNLAVLVPVLGALALVGEELLAALFGPGWSEAAGGVRILIAVGLVRAMSYVFPPLLDATGRPDLTLRYTVVAALVVPLAQIACAALLGPSLGWLSVAIAWLVAYPLAFAVLAAIALAHAGLELRTYTRAIAGELVAGGAAVIAATAAALATASLGAIARVAIVAGVTTAAQLAALAVTRSLRGRARRSS